MALWPGPTRACRSSGGPAGPVCHGDEETESLHGLQHTHGALQAEPLGRGSLAPTRPSRPSQAQPQNPPQWKRTIGATETVNELNGGQFCGSISIATSLHLSRPVEATKHLEQVD